MSFPEPIRTIMTPIIMANKGPATNAVTYDSAIRARVSRYPFWSSSALSRYCSDLSLKYTGILPPLSITVSRFCSKSCNIGDGVILVAVSYTHLRAHETRHDLVCRLL